MLFSTSCVSLNTFLQVNWIIVATVFEINIVKSPEFTRAGSNLPAQKTGRQFCLRPFYCIICYKISQTSLVFMILWPPGLYIHFIIWPLNHDLSIPYSPLSLLQIHLRCPTYRLRLHHRVLHQLQESEGAGQKGFILDLGKKKGCTSERHWCLADHLRVSPSNNRPLSLPTILAIIRFIIERTCVRSVHTQDNYALYSRQRVYQF